MSDTKPTNPEPTESVESVIRAKIELLNFELNESRVETSSLLRSLSSICIEEADAVLNGQTVRNLTVEAKIRGVANALRRLTEVEHHIHTVKSLLRK